MYKLCGLIFDISKAGVGYSRKRTNKEEVTSGRWHALVSVTRLIYSLVLNLLSYNIFARGQERVVSRRFFFYIYIIGGTEPSTGMTFLNSGPHLPS